MVQPQEVIVKVERGQYGARIGTRGFALGSIDPFDDSLYSEKTILSLEDAITVAKAILEFAATEECQQRLEDIAEDRAYWAAKRKAEAAAKRKAEADRAEIIAMIMESEYDAGAPEPNEEDEDW